MKRIVVLCSMLFIGLQSDAQQAKTAAGDDLLIKQLFFAGLRDKMKDNYAKSSESFNKIVIIDPRNAPAWYEIALLNFRQDNMPAAEQAIKNAVNINQNNRWYWKLLAELYKSTGNMDQLIPVFDQLIRLSPEQQSYYFDRANALSISGNKQSALAAYSLLEKKFGPSASLTRARERLTEDQEKVVTPGKVNTADAMAAATSLIAQKNFSAAISILRNIEDTHQDDPLFFALYGDVLYESGSLPASLSAYKKALKLTDQLYGVWEKALNIQILLGQYKEMIRMGDAALSVYPNQAILYYYMAFSLHRENQNQQALTHIQSALMLDSDNKELQALIFALQAEILIDERKPAAADIAFGKAIQLDPDNYQILNNYAYYLALRNENLDKALFLIARAARAEPHDSSIADTYGFVLLKRGRYDLARSWIERALENNETENSVYLEHYGDVLFLSGEQDKGWFQWKKSKDAGNDSLLLKRKINEKKYFK